MDDPKGEEGGEREREKGRTGAGMHYETEQGICIPRHLSTDPDTRFPVTINLFFAVATSRSNVSWGEDFYPLSWIFELSSKFNKGGNGEELIIEVITFITIETFRWNDTLMRIVFYFNRGIYSRHRDLKELSILI